jgi:hypothetical protein
MGNFGTASALVAVGVVVISTLLLTFLVTTAQGTWALRHKGKAGYPPPMPYMIPFIGHLPQFLRDAKGFLARATYVALCFENEIVLGTCITTAVLISGQGTVRAIHTRRDPSAGSTHDSPQRPGKYIHSVQKFAVFEQ